MSSYEGRMNAIDATKPDAYNRASKKVRTPPYDALFGAATDRTQELVTSAVCYASITDYGDILYSVPANAADDA